MLVDNPLAASGLFAFSGTFVGGVRMPRPTDQALEKWVRDLKELKPNEVEALARTACYGGRDEITWSAWVMQGAVPGNIRERVGNYLFEPKYWEVFSEPQQIAIMRARCIYDLYWFTTTVLKYNAHDRPDGADLEPTLHGEICESLVYDGPKVWMALVFRGALKSTIVSVADTIRRYLKAPHGTRLIVSDTSTIANDVLSAIKNHFETNVNFLKLWPELQNVSKRYRWAENSIILPGNIDRRVGTIEAIGVDGNATGKHFGEIVLDDVVTDDNSRTAEQRLKVARAAKFMMSILDPKGRVWINGTRYHDEDLYADYLKKAKRALDEYKVIIRPVYNEDGSSAWPSRFPISHIEFLKVEQQDIFPSQYLLDPVPEHSEFEPEWIEKHQYSAEDLEKIKPLLVDICMTVDPAFGESAVRVADYSAVMTCGITRAGDIYVLDCDLEKVTAPKFTDTMLDHWKRWEPSQIGFEAQAGQKGVMQMIQNVFDERKLVARLQAITRGKKQDKDARIRQVLQPYFRSGKIHVRDDMATLKLMLRRFPSWKKDGLDALADSVQILRVRKRQGQYVPTKPYEPLSAAVGR